MISLSVRKLHRSNAVAKSRLPSADVLTSVGVSANAVSRTDFVLVFAFVISSVGVGEFPLAVTLVVFPFALVYIAVIIHHFAHTVTHIAAHFAFVSPVFKFDFLHIASLRIDCFEGRQASYYQAPNLALKNMRVRAYLFLCFIQCNNYTTVVSYCQHL